MARFIGNFVKRIRSNWSGLKLSTKLEMQEEEKRKSWKKFRMIWAIDNLQTAHPKVFDKDVWDVGTLCQKKYLPCLFVCGNHLLHLIAFCNCLCIAFICLFVCCPTSIAAFKHHHCCLSTLSHLSGNFSCNVCLCYCIFFFSSWVVWVALCCIDTAVMILSLTVLKLWRGLNEKAKRGCFADG